MGSGKPSVVFFGTSEICLPFLDALCEVFHIPLIITQPDSFGGRKKKRMEPAVKSYALSKSIPFIQPDKLTRDIAELIRNQDPVIGVVISYGKFIPGKVFRVPRFNTVNVHFSLLPELRGAAPYQRAIEAGMDTTGITIFEISREMDAGDVWAAMEFSIRPDDTSATLSERMGHEGGEFLTRTLEKIIAGEIEKIAQNHSQATYAAAISKEEGVIQWDQNARNIYNKFRAFNPWPGVSFRISDKKITIKEMRISTDPGQTSPGAVLSLTREGMKVGCGENTALDILSILPQGKKEMTPYTYSLGNRIGNELD